MASRGGLWIPAKHLKLRLMACARCGADRHRAKDATLARVRPAYCWDSMEKEMRFINCLNCADSRGGVKVHRPLEKRRMALR